MSNHLDDLLAGYDPHVRDILLTVRDVILTVVPDAHEKVYPGWRTIGYGHGAGMSAQFCGLGPQKERVNLYFNRGTDLDDPAGLLEGTGKAMRHVKLTTPSDATRAEVVALIQAAARPQPHGR
jgi:hypothetical protein